MYAIIHGSTLRLAKVGLIETGYNISDDISDQIKNKKRIETIEMPLHKQTVLG